MRSELLGVPSVIGHLDFPLDLGIDCDKGYSSSFILTVGRGHIRDFVESQLLEVASDPSHLDFSLRSLLLSCGATIDYLWYRVIFRFAIRSSMFLPMIEFIVV